MVGQVGFLKTDGGPHAPDQWAVVTAQHIVQGIIPDQMAFGEDVLKWRESRDPRAVQMRKVVDRLELDVRDFIEEHHADVQAKERGGPTGGEHDMVKHAQHRNEAVAAHVDVDALCKAIADIAGKHHVALKGLFSGGEGLELLRERLRKDFGSIIQIERSWRASGHTVDGNHVARKG